MGGCVHGHAVNLCGKPAKNFAVHVWILAWEELVRFSSKTDNNGDYCVNIGTDGIFANHDANIAPYYISGADSVNNSNQCHAVNATDPPPFPAACEGCAVNGIVGSCCRYQIDYEVPAGVCKFNDPVAPNMGNMAACGGCANKQGQNAFGAPGGAMVTYNECHVICPNIPRTDIASCHWCNGSTGLPSTCWAGQVVVPGPTPDTASCNGLIDVVVDDGSPNCAPVVPVPPDPCKTSAARLLGESCDATTVCCPANNTLVCSDSLCVPTSDVSQ